MIRWPGMLLVGGAGRDSGKTRLSCALIRRLAARGAPVAGLKVTVVQDRDGPCPRGNEDGCGVCTSLEEDFCITEERAEPEGKDTALMYAAGARPVFWMRVLAEHLEAGAAALAARVGPGTVCVCESNSLRRALEPGLFLIIQRRGARGMKRSSRELLHLADRLVLSDDRGYDMDLDDLRVAGGRWTLPPRGAD